MKKFKFKLETVLNVKIKMEDLRQKELHNTESSRDLAKSALEQRREEMAATTIHYREALRERLDLFRALSYQRYLEWQEKQVEQAVLLLEEREREVEAARQRLIIATQERKAVDKLKESAYQEYLAEELRTEISFLDELGTGRFVRQEKDEDISVNKA
jgi:flagellar FliJ protein